VDIKSQQGVVYSIPCCDCDKRYIGGTTRSLETRQKKRKADVKNKRFDLNHRMDWDNSKVLDFESKSFHINSERDTMNENRSD